MHTLNKIIARAGVFSGAAVLAVGAVAAAQSAASASDAQTQTLTTACGQPFNLTAPRRTIQLAIVAYGANGGSGGAAASSNDPGQGGTAGGVTVTFKVKPGQKFHGVIGCGGQNAPQGGGVVATGGQGGAGFEAGANGGDGWYCVGIPGACINGPDGSGGGGGGSTGLYKGTSTIPLFVAAGGGGGASYLAAGSVSHKFTQATAGNGNNGSMTVIWVK